MKYTGITHPGILTKWPFFQLWKRYLCPRNMHIFDEVASCEHYLCCDACGLTVHISLVETEEEGCERAKSGKYIRSVASELPDTAKGRTTEMGAMKNFAMEVSYELGFDGEITDEVIEEAQRRIENVIEDNRSENFPSTEKFFAGRNKSSQEETV